MFNSDKTQVTMTPADEKLLENTRRLFDSQAQARELLTESRAARSGTLHIVSNSALHMLNVLARFREKYPGVWVMISHDNTHTVTESLFRYDTDIAILGELTHPGRT